MTEDPLTIGGIPILMDPLDQQEEARPYIFPFTIDSEEVANLILSIEDEADRNAFIRDLLVRLGVVKPQYTVRVTV